MLEHLAAFYGVERQVVQAADATANPPIPLILEDDERLRARAQLAPESFTTAGSEGSYRFWALAASSEVKDVAVQEGDPGDVILTILSTDGSGISGQPLLDLVFDEVYPRRPLTDRVTVQSATILEYQVPAVLTLYDGPDAEVVRTASQNAAQAYVDGNHKLGHDITIAGLHAALYVPGVQNVDLGTFAADLIIGPTEVGFCTLLTVTVGGRDV